MLHCKKLVFTDHESCTKPGLNFKISRCFIKRKPHVNLVKGYIGIGTVTDIRNPLLIMIFLRFPHVIPIKILVQIESSHVSNICNSPLMIMFPAT